MASVRSVQITVSLFNPGMSSVWRVGQRGLVSPLSVWYRAVVIVAVGRQQVSRIVAGISIVRVTMLSNVFKLIILIYT